MQHTWECQLESNTGSKEGHISTIFVKHTLELFGKYKLFPSSVKIRQVTRLSYTVLFTKILVVKTYKEVNKLLTDITLSDLLTGINYKVISDV